MRYSKEHKAQTRERILDEAAPLFRQYGFDGVSVDQLMQAAGLTRGAFYAHFDSKEALLADVMARDSGLVKMLQDRKGPKPADLNAQASAILSDYLDPSNRAEVGEGCPLASMAGDAARGPTPLRRRYGDRFSALIKHLQRGLGRSRKDEADAVVAAVLAVGGVLISRAIDDAATADRVEQICRQEVRARLSRI